MGAIEAPPPEPAAPAATVNPAAATAPAQPVTAPPADDDGPDAWADWRRTRDPSSGKCYYYNSRTSETTWTQPADWGRALPAVASGFYYADLQGATQGPFQAAQLAAWRGMLPMELPVWHVDDAGQAYAAAPLAQVVGDLALLTQLRSGQLSLPPNATAAQVETALAAQAQAQAASPGKHAVWEDDAWWAAQQAAQDGEAPEEGAGSGLSFAELAAASLAGLPEEERARVLAGGSVEATAPRRTPDPADEYASAPVLNRLTGRVTSASALRGEDALAATKDVSREYFSAQLAHHMDVNTLDAWLADMQARKHEKLPPAVWKQLKERRLEKKRKLNNAWLRD